MLAVALEAEVAANVAAHVAELDEHGHRLAMRNGHAVPRQVLTSVGAVEVHAPRVNNKRVDEATGEQRRFASLILPAWCRKSTKVTECYRCCTCMACPARTSAPRWKGSSAPTRGLSAATITRLTVRWQDEARAFNARDLSKMDHLFLSADGIHVNIRLDEEKLCLLVLIGVRVDGPKELVALAGGYRESSSGVSPLGSRYCVPGRPSGQPGRWGKDASSGPVAGSEPRRQTLIGYGRCCPPAPIQPTCWS